MTPLACYFAFVNFDDWLIGLNSERDRLAGVFTERAAVLIFLDAVIDEMAAYDGQPIVFAEVVAGRMRKADREGKYRMMWNWRFVYEASGGLPAIAEYRRRSGLSRNPSERETAWWSRKSSGRWRLLQRKGVCGLNSKPCKPCRTVGHHGMIWELRRRNPVTGTQESFSVGKREPSQRMIDLVNERYGGVDRINVDQKRQVRWEIENE